MSSIAIIGAGMGGLVAALLLASAGCAVDVFEAQATPGGKLRELAVGSARIDAGPTVFTLKPVFDSIFTEAGARFDDHVATTRLDVLARHIAGQVEAAAIRRSRRSRGRRRPPATRRSPRAPRRFSHCSTILSCRRRSRAWPG
jgi:phytoene dehydrogenase-like protein